MKKSNSVLPVIFATTLALGFSSCGSDSESSTAALSPVAQKKGFLESIQFARATANADGIELALTIDGSRTVAASGALDAQDVVLLQGDKDGKLTVLPVSGMDIRGEGECETSSCQSAKVRLNVNESEFDSTATELSVAISTKARCTIKSLTETEDALATGLKKVLKERIALSLVEKTAGTARYFAIANLGTGATPFFRADLQPQTGAQFDLVELDAAGTATAKSVDVRVDAAEITQAPRAVKAVLSHNGQPSTELNCTF